jgi:hypothetical protein
MKELFGVLLASAVLVGATALSIHQFGDRELMTPPPDAAAEQFVRAIVAKRFEQAKKYLAKPASESELHALQEQLGDATEIEAKLLSRDEERAMVGVSAESNALTFALVFEKEWKVEL